MISVCEYASHRVGLCAMFVVDVDIDTESVHRALSTDIVVVIIIVAAHRVVYLTAEPM